MSISISKDKLTLGVFFLMCFLCLAVGLYFDKRKENSGELVLDIPLEQDVFVDISGAVAAPGVYKLAIGSRVNDVLRLSGGVLDNASIEWVSKNLNLSEKLSDSQKLYVPFDWEVQEYEFYEIAPLVAPKNVNEPTGESTDNAKDLVNVNTATADELEGLPGVGEVTAERIIENRPYEDFEDLKVNASLTNSVIGKIEGLVTF